MFVGLSHWVDIISWNSDDIISYVTFKSQINTERSSTSQKIEQIKNQLEKLPNAKNTTNKIARRIKNSWTSFTKKHIQISIDKLRDKEQIILELVHKSDIIQGEVTIYLDDAGIKQLIPLVIPKVAYSFYDRGVRLDKYFLSSVMCHEQPESIRYVFSKPPSISYIGWEEIDGSMLELVW
jgi:hypothetical protein